MTKIEFVIIEWNLFVLVCMSSIFSFVFFIVDLLHICDAQRSFEIIIT